MSKTETLAQQDQRLLHPMHHQDAYEGTLYFEHADGIYLHTTDGRKVIDGMSGLWNVNVGHGRRELADAAYAQMAKGAFISNFAGSAADTTVELADRLAGFAYPDLNSTFFTTGGAEANEAAFKTVRYYWKGLGKPDKTQIVGRLRGYHGLTLAAMSATGISMYWRLFEPRVPGFLHINMPDPYRFAGEVRAGETVGTAAARELEELIQQEGADTIGAFIAEPVAGVGGVVVPPDDYFPRIRAICDEYDVLMISDEVITGWGRTGKWFGLHHWGVQPDIISFAKAITSGYLPLGGIQVHDRVREVMDRYAIADRWAHTYTYSGHPTCCAVALANLDILEAENYADRGRHGGYRLMGALRHLEESDHVGEVRGLGMMLAVEMVEDKSTKVPDPDRAASAQAACLERGLSVRFLGNSLVLAPPLCAADEELDTISSIVVEAVTEAAPG